MIFGQLHLCFHILADMSSASISTNPHSLLLLLFITSNKHNTSQSLCSSTLGLCRGVSEQTREGKGYIKSEREQKEGRVEKRGRERERESEERELECKQTSVRTRERDTFWWIADREGEQKHFSPTHKDWTDIENVLHVLGIFKKLDPLQSSYYYLFTQKDLLLPCQHAARYNVSPLCHHFPLSFSLFSVFLLKPIYPTFFNCIFVLLPINIYCYFYYKYLNKNVIFVTPVS